jgi:hypothetical protein
MRSWLALAVAVMSSGCYVEDRHHYYEPAPSRGETSTGTAEGFQLSWKLVDAQVAGADPTYAPAMSCATAGIAEVQVDLVDVDTADHFTWQFPCETDAGVTPAVPLGRYDVTVDALDPSGAPRSHDGWRTDNYYTSDLGLVVFVIDLSA